MSPAGLRRMPAARSVAALLILALAPAAAAETPQIYKWVDSNGIAHYTTDRERIPAALRNRIRSVNRTPASAESASTPEATVPQATSPVPAPQANAAVPIPAPGASTTVPAPVPQTGGASAASVPRAAIPNAAVPQAAMSASPTLAAPRASTVRSPDGWFERDAIPHIRASSLLASGEASPAQLEALASEREALDARIAEVQAEVHQDEDFLKALISNPELDADVPLFDRPEFLEVSRRLPELQGQLQELRDQRAKLETP